MCRYMKGRNYGIYSRRAQGVYNWWLLVDSGGPVQFAWLRGVGCGRQPLYSGECLAKIMPWTHVIGSIAVNWSASVGQVAERSDFCCCCCCCCSLQMSMLFMTAMPASDFSCHHQQHHCCDHMINTPPISTGFWLRVLWCTFCCDMLSSNIR